MDQTPSGTDSPLQTPRRRRPRFSRVTQSIALQLTDRDVEIVRHVASHRFLRSSHLSTLLRASHQKISERLTALFHAGFLDRPRSQLQYHVRGGGSEYYVYALGTRGAHLLRECGASLSCTIDWTRKNRDATHQFLQHTLAVADVRVALAVACRERPGVVLRSAEDLLGDLPAQTRAARRPWSWRVSLQSDGGAHQLGVIPDYVFAIMLPESCCATV